MATCTVLSTALRADRPAAPPPQLPSVCNIQTTQRVVAIGDVHGASIAFTGILRAAGLIDDESRWSGGDTILVQLGDLVDRGPDSRSVIDLLMRLEREAAAAGGRVIVLLGNHDVMRLMRDFRYVSAGEYAGYRSTDAENLREAYYRAVLANEQARVAARGLKVDEGAFRKQFLEQVPIGFVETLAAFGPESIYGAWMRTHEVMVRINGVAFVHAGVTRQFADLGCQGINARARTEMANLPAVDDPAAADTLLAGPDGPLWTTRLVADDSPLGDDDVSRLLEDQLGARALVVGHAVTTDHRIQTRFGDRVIEIDTGMLGGSEFAGGRASALEIKDGVVSAIYTDRTDRLFELPAWTPPLVAPAPE